MHNQLMGSTGLDQESRLAHASSGAYANDSWVDLNAVYQHQAASMPGFGTNFNDYITMPHGLPSELPPDPLAGMPPPPHPPPQPQPQTQTTHPLLPQLIMPSHPTWPSMLTNPNNYTPHSAPPVSIPSVTAVLKPARLSTIHASSQPRRTLTDEDRRRMCQYAEDHPGTKQTEIGAMFGVERSTVSKVLRNKDKYLLSEERSGSPIKRSKGKSGDIEKTLTNYIRNAQKSGAMVTDADLKERLRIFASAHPLSSSAEATLKANSSTWLEKFKQKNGIGQGRLLRRASETSIPDNLPDRPPQSSSQPSSAISPVSPPGHNDLSPLSANRSDDDRESMSSFMDFTAEPRGYKHANSQSTTSLSSAFTDAANSSFPGSALSPTTPFPFSPDPSVGDFLSASQIKQMSPTDTSSNGHRPRSQTFPTLDLECMGQQQQAEPLTPRYHISATAPSSALESPVHEISPPRFGLDAVITSPRLRHSSSSGSMGTRTTTTPGTSSAVPSSPSSPTQEDARRAADTLLSYIQNAGGFVDQNEYLAVVRLTEKLRLHHAQMSKAGAPALGGLSRIPEGDSEMPNAPPAIMSELQPTALGA